MGTPSSHPFMFISVLDFNNNHPVYWVSPFMETSIFLWFSHGLPMDHPTSSQCIPMVSGTPATLSRVTQVGLLSLYTPEMMAPISEHESSTMGIYMHLYIYTYHT